VSYGRAKEIIAKLDEEVAQLMAKAEEADNKPLEEGLTIPDEIARRQERKAALEAAKKVMEARYQEAQEEAAKEEGLKEKSDDDTKNKAGGISHESALKKAKKPIEKYQYNFTDPESRIMKEGNSGGFEQCYNAEAAVDTEGSMLILGGYVTQHGNDKLELAPAVQSVDSEIREVTTVAADTGFYSEAGVAAVEQTDEQGERQGPTVYCAVETEGHHRSVEDIEKQGPLEELPEKATAKQKMARRLKTKQGKSVYKKRKETVEPVFGIIKAAMGFRQFMLRGLEEVSTEWAAMFRYDETRRPAIQTIFTGGPAMFRYGETREAENPDTFSRWARQF
jgi:multidrug efflux pump subunit AcrA (membrane-fusion protein)